MPGKLLVGMCTYMDGKHESQVQFQSEFPGFVTQNAHERNIDLECRLVRLVGCDEMSRKKDFHTIFPTFEIEQIIEYDSIFDRIGTIVPTGGIFLDKAVYSGSQVFNRPVSIDECKARDYMIAAMMGFQVPQTVILPQACYVRARMEPNGVVSLDADLDEAVQRVGGYPCFFKKAFGGGRAHVYRVKNRAELYELYQHTREYLMVLQENVEFDLYIRTFCFGRNVIHTAYDIDKPDGQKYTWPTGEFSEQDRIYLDRTVLALANALTTPFCTMEATRSRKDGRWYFIDITNGCNFDMREGELSTPIYRVAKQTLADEILDRTLNPRPMIVHTHLQAHVLKQQIFRAILKGQNPEFLFEFARQIGLNLQTSQVDAEQRYFEERYRSFYGNP